jgi:hypothetical protein
MQRYKLVAISMWLNSRLCTLCNSFWCGKTGGAIYQNFRCFSTVADPGCLFRIRIFSDPHPGSRVKKFGIPDPHQRI